MTPDPRTLEERALHALEQLPEKLDAVLGELRALNKKLAPPPVKRK
jgi:hypothetical protein